jgi:uncharacterized lipoprotein YajG
MDRQEKLRRYDNIMAVLVVLAVAAMLLASCSTQRGSCRPHAPTKTPENWTSAPNRNCGWAY